MKRFLKNKLITKNMKSVSVIFTFLLLVFPNVMTAQQDSTAVSRLAQGDACKSKNDSITWNKELEGIVIKAQKQLIKQDIDRIGYDVQADEESKTLTVLDMLRKVPMVTVDGEDNIKVKGNSSFKIYKNGHYDPSLSKNAKEILKAMPASAVKRIEVITDPGAREDAEGVDAILNIVMVDGRRLDGVTGSVTASYNTLEHPNLSAYLTTQLGKTIVSLNYGYGGMSSKETEHINYAERTYTASGNTMKGQNQGSNPGYIHYADIDASYDIDSLNLLSASLSGYFYKLDVKGGGTTQMYSPANSLLYGYSNTYWMPGYNHHSWNGRLDYQHKTRREGELLTLSYMLALTRQNDQQESNYTDMQNTPFNYTGMLNDSHERFTEHTFQADYVHPITQGHKLEVGGKYIYRGNSSHTVQDFYATTPYPTYDSQFEHTTQVAAAYADYMVNLDKWSARAGLRYEHSYMKGHYPDGSDSDFGRHLNDWVPQASVKYQINDANSLKLEYTTSISRPGISYLNPAVVSSPTQVTYGNAELSSCRKQTIYLIYSYIGRWLTLQLAPAYKYFDDGIGRLVYAKDDIRYQTYGNLERLHRWQFEGYVQWKPFKTTTLSTNFNMSYDNISNPSLDLKHSGFSGFYYINGSQQLPWKLRFIAFIYGQTGHTVENVYSYQRPWTQYGFSLQRSFLKDNRLTLRINANNLFSKYNHYISYTTQGDTYGYSDSAQRGRRINFSLSYRFGKLKASVKKTETTIENSDVVGGITKGQ